MSLAAGTRLGPYEILGLIGAGGMGEVYKARDTRLDRTVAIKVLPSELSGSPDRRARFEREAKSIAGLAHPHICTLHDVGDHGGSLFLVMEHLDGATLAHRLEKGPLPIEHVLTIATEIADALSAAHRQGIIHRDLKPGNVMLTKSGAKLLDFGLAKLTGHGDQAAAAPVMSAPTRSAPLTGEGVIVGTLQYMAPEQLEGKPADARTDLWALGAIVYEMVTGKRAFEGASAASLITAIMSAETPAPSSRQPLTPPALDRLVRTCLAKDPEQRFHSAHDLSLDLAWMRDMLGQTAPVGIKPAKRRPGWFGVLGGALIGVAVAVVVLQLPWRSAVSIRPVVRYTVEVPPLRKVGSLALSPDGSHLVYAGMQGDHAALYRRSRDQFTESVIPDTEGGLSPFFSPDGQWIAFFRAGRLLKIRLDGRDLTTICLTSSGAGSSSAGTEIAFNREGVLYSGRWNADGTIVYSAGSSHVWLVSPSGAAPVPITKLDPGRGDLAHRWPVLLPGGKTLLYSVLTGMVFDAVPVVAGSLETGATRIVLPNAPAATYLATGHLLYVDRGSLVAIRFDADRLEAAGTPVPIVDGIGYSTAQNAAPGYAPQFAVTRRRPGLRRSAV